jgi:hypothetical protein
MVIPAALLRLALEVGRILPELPVDFDRQHVRGAEPENVHDLIQRVVSGLGDEHLRIRDHLLLAGQGGQPLDLQAPLA